MNFSGYFEFSKSSEFSHDIIISYVDIRCLSEDIKYFNEIRGQIVQHVSAKK